MTEIKTNLTQDQLNQIQQLVTFEEDSEGVLSIKHVYDNVGGSVFGDVKGGVFGNVKGSVFGSVTGSVWGDVWGSVFGDVRGSVKDGS
jgi:outer membrane lipoprotein SlyB